MKARYGDDGPFPDIKSGAEIIAMRVHQGVWVPSENDAARHVLSDPDAVSMTVTYDDGSQIVFQRKPDE